MLKVALLSLLLSGVPGFSNEPAFIRINVRVKNVREAVQIAVVIDGENFYRRSDQALETNRTSYQFEFPSVPGGEYAVIAAVSDRTGKILEQTEKPLTVIGRFGG